MFLYGLLSYSKVPFDQGFQSSSFKPCKMYMLICQQVNEILSQFSTCHDSQAVVTCGKLWRYLKIRMKTIAKRISHYKLINSLRDGPHACYANSRNLLVSCQSRCRVLAQYPPGRNQIIAVTSRQIFSSVDRNNLDAMYVWQRGIRWNVYVPQNWQLAVEKGIIGRNISTYYTVFIDSFTWRRHDIDTLSALLVFVKGIHRTIRHWFIPLTTGRNFDVFFF